MGTDSNQWGANGKAVEKFRRYVVHLWLMGEFNGDSLGKFKWYFLPFVINGRSMEYHWEYSSGTYFDSILMGV